MQFYQKRKKYFGGWKNSGNEEKSWEKTGDLEIFNPDENPSILFNAFYTDRSIILVTEWRCIVIQRGGADGLIENSK